MIVSPVPPPNFKPGQIPPLANQIKQQVKQLYTSKLFPAVITVSLRICPDHCAVFGFSHMDAASAQTYLPGIQLLL